MRHSATGSIEPAAARKRQNRSRLSEPAVGPRNASAAVLASRAGAIGTTLFFCQIALQLDVRLFDIFWRGTHLFVGKGNVFINYRRDDSRFAAGLIYERLRRQFSASRLFIDVDSITGGADFQKLLENRLGQTRVMLSIIGDRWVDIRSQDGNRRLEETGDFVRLEIVRALAHGITIIPVLLDQAQLPDTNSLPPDLRPLLDRQVRRVRHETFGPDMAVIVNDIKLALRPPPEVVARRNRRIAAGVVAAMAVGGGAATHEFWLTPMRDAAHSVQTVWSDYQQSLRDRARIADQADWDVAVKQSSIIGYERYLKEQPSGQYTTEAQRQITALREAEEWQRVARETAAREEQQRQRLAREQEQRNEDEAAWATAQKGGQVLDYRIYLMNRPNGLFADAAQRRMEEIEEAQKRALIEEQRRRELAAVEAERAADQQAWDQAQKSGQALAYRLYLQQKPSGQFVADAQKQISALEEAQKRAQAEEQRKRELEAAEALRKADKEAWDQAQASGQVLAYRLYLQQRPSGRFAADALKRIAALEEAQRRAQAEEQRRREQEAVELARTADKEAWDQAQASGQILAYRFYLQQRPSGEFASEAQKRIAALEEAERIAAEELRVKREAAVLAAAEQEDERRWQEARGEDNAAAYRAYLLQRSGGRYADTARKRLEELAAQDSEREAQRQSEIADLRRRLEAQAAAFAADARSGQSGDQAPSADSVAPASATDVATLTRELQRELKRVGCDPGEADGVWGVKAETALKSFAGYTKIAVLTEQPTIGALDALMSQKLRVCPEQCSKGERLENGKCVRIERERRQRLKEPIVRVPQPAAVAKQGGAVRTATGGSFVAQANALRAACKSGNAAACRTGCNAGNQAACNFANRLQYGSGLTPMGKRR